MQILLTIFVLSIATHLVCWAYDLIDPHGETHALLGVLSVASAFFSGLLAALTYIWS